MHSAVVNSVLGTSVLVLNRSYVAIRVVTVRRAFVLLYRDTAEVIHIENGAYANYDFQTWCELSRYWAEGLLPGHADDWVRTVQWPIHAPRIIRLLQFDQAPRHGVRLNRRNLFARDGNRCQYCGRDFPHHQLSCDHITPRSRGGTTTWENVVTCCLTCNTRKGDRTPQEAGMKLRARPVKPKDNPVLKVKLGQPRYQSWQPFLGESAHVIEVA